MSVSHLIYETTSFSLAIFSFSQLRNPHQENHFDGIIPQLFQPANEEPSSLLKKVDSHEVRILPKSSCLFGLTSGIAASFLTKNPLLLLMGLSECFPKASAQQKVGSEFQINTYTNSSQWSPSVTSFSNGNFVVTWQSNGQDGSAYGVYGQLFDGNGTKIGSEFQVNTYMDSDQWFPSVASFSNGNFVVTWHSDGQDGSWTGVYGQLFNGNGTKIGNEFRANSNTNLGFATACINLYISVSMYSNEQIYQNW